MIVLLLIIFFDKVERKFRYEVDVKFMWIGFVNAMGEMFLSLCIEINGKLIRLKFDRLNL